MPFRSRDEEYDEFDEDLEIPGEEMDERATDACPYCSEEIYDDANWCPYCTNYISREDAPSLRRPGWLVAGVILCLAIVASWFFFF